MILTIPLLSHINDPGYSLQSHRLLIMTRCSLSAAAVAPTHEYAPKIESVAGGLECVIHSSWMSGQYAIHTLAFNALVAEIRIVDPDVTE